MNKTFGNLENLLKKDDRFVSQDGKIMRNAVYEAANKMDEKLLLLLTTNEEIKKTFFKTVNGMLIFDKQEFNFVISNRELLPDSYTRFKQKIGLVDSKNDFIVSKNDVVLSFPFKDCLLAGGQTKEEDKRNEVFINETLSVDKINTIKYKKTLTNAIKFEENNEIAVDVFENDNMVIKGNNYYSLCSLLHNYRNKIKLIYIDPPYNTNNDSFSYNDNFNHSTWLTFMKDRLKLAKELLTDDGSIYVNIDYNEVHYLKVLMDEIFGRENFQREIIWRIGWLSGYKTIDKNCIRNHDTILYYSKNNKKLYFNKEKAYIYNDKFKESVNDKDLKEICKKLEIDNTKAKTMYTFINHTQRIEKYPIEDVWNANEYDDLNSIAIVSFSGETVSKMLGCDEVKGQKSEALLKRIIECSTNEGDIVLDFFAGTGTTGAVALKMNRKFILCEQLDRHIDIECKRLKKVISGSQEGISKDVNWQGGGSFIYCELKKLNQEYIDKIKSINNKKELAGLALEVLHSDFISCNIDVEKVIGEFQNIEELEIDDLKKVIIELLDKNQLYVNYSDIDDEDMKISDKDKKFNKSFYGE